MSLFVFALLSVPQSAAAQVTAFRQAVAEAAARDDDLAAFYRARSFEGIWSHAEDADRRNALLGAFAGASDHGLPSDRYDTNALIARIQAARTPAEQGAMEVELSRLFLQYARDVQTGVLRPKSVVPLIVREVPLRDRLDLLNGLLNTNAATFLRALPPSSPEYTRLMRQKLEMEQQLTEGGWGQSVPAGRLEVGASGAAVVALRNRLIAMGYLERTATQTFDATMKAAVEEFQRNHGLDVDGTVGEGTLAQINIPMEKRLQSVIVAMERERWTNMERGDRHVWVNLTDFTANVVDFDRTTFSTRSVIGARDADRQSPEFSDIMEHMVINPSWYVPRSITTREYLPQMQRNRGAAGHLQIINSRGQVVSRNSINFNRYNASNFPFSMRQPPSSRNALGLVKFMFPNRYNIYLHDTPAKSLFGREVRAYSHGCIRLNDPFDFAYHLLAAQTADPVGFFQSRLRTGAESRVNLEVQVPVHIVYRTAFTDVDGQIQFRRDIYDRDRRIWNALSSEGVALRAFQG
ncbi:L,D-transpeptidase family protein [Yoonia sp. 208BN28-4]|uniref:L,D-transpeptidase family protein n=1 Tax=Yoonia sp. 208BN28-4 TaxID=3126505 RepID=UPI0030A9E4E4